MSIFTDMSALMVTEILMVTGRATEKRKKVSSAICSIFEFLFDRRAGPFGLVSADEFFGEASPGAMLSPGELSFFIARGP